MTADERAPSCETCRFFLDYRRPNDQPGEMNGYCGQLMFTRGLEAAVKVNEYGGHWTRHDLWCDKWQPVAPSRRPCQHRRVTVDPSGAMACEDCGTRLTP